MGGGYNTARAPRIWDTANFQYDLRQNHTLKSLATS